MKKYIINEEKRHLSVHVGYAVWAASDGGGQLDRRMKTEAGEELLPYARQALKASQACLDRIQDLQHLLMGTLNIGVTFSFSPILTEALFAFI
ncbi:MAG: LysR family transcriptional regulator, partial [Firmicutes bacterium]|nr:LysR family transcriptional regulator [Bacillota bacterium]